MPHGNGIPGATKMVLFRVSSESNTICNWSFTKHPTDELTQRYKDPIYVSEMEMKRKIR